MKLVIASALYTILVSCANTPDYNYIGNGLEFDDFEYDDGIVINFRF